MTVLEYIFAKYVLPLLIFFGIIITIIIILIVWILISAKKEQRRDDYMKSHGYTERLRGVSSVGGKEYWEFIKGDSRIDRVDLYRMKMRDIKQRYR